MWQAVSPAMTLNINRTLIFFMNLWYVCVAKLVKAEGYEKRKNQVFAFFISETPPLPLWGNWEMEIRRWESDHADVGLEIKN